MQRTKDITFIGFALKSRGIILGANSVYAEKKRKYLLLLCQSAAKNTAKDFIAYAARQSIPAIKTCGVLLEDIVNKSNCKVAAITDRHLAEAVLNNLSDNFENISGGIFNE